MKSDVHVGLPPEQTVHCSRANVGGAWSLKQGVKGHVQKMPPTLVLPAVGKTGKNCQREQLI